MIVFLEDFELVSPSLGQSRRVTVFRAVDERPSSALPVLYCADGQALHAFASTLTAATHAGSTPPVTLIGPHSYEATRAQEYVTGIDEQRFLAHERFFTNELCSWAESQFGIRSPRESCGIFGFSNGSALAISMAARHPHRYGAVIAFSVPGDPNRVVQPPIDPDSAPRYYLSAGTREAGFRRTTKAISQILLRQGIECQHTERAARHDLRFWCAELPQAIAWSFS
ncbi:MAG: hypothetical protein KDB00_18420 [Planctomycetales bacterium]|nr:hypothetical protein [Planctomycetales bacterium]